MVRKNRQQKSPKLKSATIALNIDPKNINSNGFKCKYCEFALDTAEDKLAHEVECDANPAEASISADEKMQFLCTVCNQLFKYETGLKKHKLRHKPPGGFVCPECNARFVTDAERLLHKEVVHKIFKCMICNEKCLSEESFLNHINELHDGRDREYVVCGECGAQFRQKNQLRLHCESKCGTIRCYSCNQCDSKFMTQNTLNAHMLIHTGEKKHLCNFCGNSFLSRGQLKIHERSHTKEKPYKCLVCNKAFAHRESLVTHSSLHTGIKPYQCQCCGNQFSCIGNLIKHRRIRPQTCGLPKYSNVKCAPRASTKVPGSLTLKKERVAKRSYSKRKIISVPELLSERAELTNQSNEMKMESTAEDQEFQEYIILNESKSNTTVESIQSSKTEAKSELSEEMTSFQQENIEIMGQEEEEVEKVFSQPTSSNTISYSIQKPSVLVLTADGNYVIASLENEVQKSNEIQVAAPPPIEQIIILNGSDLQFAEMAVDCQTEGLTDDKGNIDLLNVRTTLSPSSSSIRNPLTVVEQSDEVEEPRYVENSIQHLEIVPADNGIDGQYIKMEESNEVEVLEEFVCELCAKSFKLEKSLIKHLNSKHNIECDFFRFKCKYCHKQYSKENLLNRHMKCHGSSGELRYKCSCCPKYFDTKEKMQDHARIEHEDRLKCNFCHKIYKEVDTKMAHIRKVHMKTGAPQKKYTFVCAKCGKKFNSKIALSDHEQANCGQSPLYKCSYENCGKALHSLGSLKIHQLIHTGDLPFSCNFCKKKFRTQGQVKVHERSHSGEKPFKCNQCPKAFAHRESLLTHLSLHTGVKRFACQGCGGRFSCISNLQAHRRTHQATCGQLPLDTRAQYSYSVDDGSITVPEVITS